MSARRAALLLLALAACGDGPTSTAASASASATTSEGESEGSTSASSSTGAATDATTTTSTTASAGESEGTSTGVAARCGDGIAEPGELCFTPPVLVPAGADPVDLVVADLDRDGLLDVALADIAGPRVIALYGDGVGGLPELLELPGLNLPRAIAALQTDASAPRDLACADLNFSAIGHYRAGARPRTYALPTATPLGDRPRALLAADLDGDGDDDLIAVSEGSDAVIVAFLEAGEIVSTQDYPVGDEPYAAALGDLNGDGRPDLAVVNRKHRTASILRGDGPGTFAPSIEVDTAEDPRAVTLGDLDHDGLLDVAIACYESRRIQILRGHGDGVTFTDLEFQVDAGVYAIAAGDLDHDGRDDLAAVDFDGGDLVVLRGFQAEIPTLDRLPLSGGPFDLELADFNKDGALDVAVAAHAGGVDLLLADP